MTHLPQTCHEQKKDLLEFFWNGTIRRSKRGKSENLNHKNMDKLCEKKEWRLEKKPGVARRVMMLNPVYELASVR